MLKPGVPEPCWGRPQLVFTSLCASEYASSAAASARSDSEMRALTSVTVSACCSADVASTRRFLAWSCTKGWRTWMNLLTMVTFA